MYEKMILFFHHSLDLVTARSQLALLLNLFKHVRFPPSTYVTTVTGWKVTLHLNGPHGTRGNVMLLSNSRHLHHSDNVTTQSITV